jgi:transcriptional regulator with XRE-family HTH domain
MTERKGRIGSSFDEFLKEEGLYEEVTAGAIKRVLTRQITEAMAAGGISKSEMARRMRTSRSQLDRLLDPENTKIQLDTLYKAASAVGRRVRLELMEESA